MQHQWAQGEKEGEVQVEGEGEEGEEGEKGEKGRGLLLRVQAGVAGREGEGGEVGPIAS